MTDAEYWARVEVVADDLGADGCTMAGSAFRRCCLRHDAEYRTGRTVLSKRRLTRLEADKRFLACMQRHSLIGWYSPLAWVRYWAVRRFGASAWKGEGE